MSTIVTRAGKGSPLTNTEVDANFSNLNDDKVEKSGDTLTGDLAFGDNVKATFGAGDDLQIFHTSTLSQIQDSGTGELRIASNGTAIRLWDTANLQNLAVFNIGGKSGIYFNGSEKLATTSSGVDVTGTLVSDQLKIEGATGPLINLYRSDVNALFGAIQFKDTTNTNENARIGWAANELRLQGTNQVRLLTDDKARLLATAAGNVLFYEDTGTTAKLTWDASAEELQFKDNVKAEFGDGGDLQIYHDGSYSYVSDQGTGDLLLQGNNLRLVNYPWTKNYLTATNGGHVNLYYDGVVKFATTSTGIDVTGTVTADDSVLIEGGVAQLILNETDVSQGNSALINSGGQFSIRYRSDDGGTTTRRLAIDNNSGDISFYSDDGSSQDFYWDASTSRLGLGTTSPAEELHISASVPKIQIQDSDGTNQYGQYYHSAGSTSILSRNGNADGQILFQRYDGTTTSESMRIDSSGNVGIGTTSPSALLSLSKAGAGTIGPSLRLHNTSSRQINNTARISFAPNSDYVTGYDAAYIDVVDTAGTTANPAAMVFGIGSGGSPTEAMRLDSSGNLLVGKTSASISTAGGEIRSSGIMAATVSNGTPLYLSRLSTDGEIVQFRKDGGTVGSIGTSNDQIYIGRDDTGIRFTSGDDALLPVNANSGALRSGAIDLGRSYSTFRNLYLSGGVYLGGTGSANLLDDYEEGTWTPVYEPATGSFTTMTMDVVTATYTKIGDTVRINCFIRTDDVDVTGASGAISISGLPFAANAYNSLAVGYALGWATNKNPVGAYTNSNTSEILITEQTAIGGATSSATVDSFATGTNTNYNRIIVTGVYTTNA